MVEAKRSMAGASDNSSHRPRMVSGNTQGVPTEDTRPQAEAYRANTGRRRNNAGRAQKQPQVRKVNDFIVFLDDVLGMGQYGKVCKAQLAKDLL